MILCHILLCDTVVQATPDSVWRLLCGSTRPTPEGHSSCYTWVKNVLAASGLKCMYEPGSKDIDKTAINDPVSKKKKSPPFIKIEGSRTFKSAIAMLIWVMPANQLIVPSGILPSVYGEGTAITNYQHQDQPSVLAITNGNDEDYVNNDMAIVAVP